MMNQNYSPDPKIAKFLSHYFALRGSFLAQAILADFQTLRPFINQKGNGKSATNYTVPHPAVREPGFLTCEKSGECGENEENGRMNENSVPLTPPTLPTLVRNLGEHQPISPVTSRQTIDVQSLLVNLIVQQTGYPLNSIELNSRMLDDLNLDSIKAGELVAAAASKCGVAGKIDPSTFANATIADVVVALEQVKTMNQVQVNQAAQNRQVEAPNSWVRNFTVEYIAQDAPYCAVENWSVAKVLIVSDRPQDPLTKALAAQLLSLNAVVEQCTYDQGLLPGSFSHYLAVLPQSTSFSLPLAQMVARLASIATPAKTDTRPCVAYVQFGGGRFGTGSENPEGCCAAAFARSLHLERSDLRVRVVDLALEIAPHCAAELVISELSGTEAIATVGYDANLTRLVPQHRLQQPAHYSQRPYTWSQADVILVTGGAKGITAECAFALAQSTGVKVALVGRSPVPTNGEGEIASTLERYAQQGLICGYYSCDIVNRDAVTELVNKITLELGKITGVIHGAGLNTPRRVEQVNLETALAEVSPKLLGADNLLQTLASAPPKLFVAFSSIIGVTGMPGNTWYAFANESLAMILRRFQREHPETQVLSLAYSIWGEVGMGVKMGSIKNLERMGISAISTSEGVSRFLKLFECDPGVSQVAITARLGGLDTWYPVNLPPTPELRFIDRVIRVEPGVELIARVHLTLERDRYVRDHIWQGSYLFPAVFGLEAMAQATAYVTGEKNPEIVRIENISLRKPVVVDPQNGANIEIHAEVQEADSTGERKVKVGIRTEQTGFISDHFSATLVLGKLRQGAQAAPKVGQALAIKPKIDLYGSLLFQGSLFQQIDEVFSLTREYSIIKSHARTSSQLREEEGSHFILGDPYFRDVLLQSMQLNIPQDICLPVEIERIELFQNPAVTEGERIIQAILNQKEGREYICEVITTNQEGYVVEHLSGYRLQILEEHPEHPTAVELANPEERDRHKLRQVIDTTFQKLGLTGATVQIGYSPNLGRQSQQQRRQIEKLLVAHGIKQQMKLPTEAIVEFEINTLPSGKPHLTGAAVDGYDLSLSHDDHYCLCTVGESVQGCDIEAITHRSPSDWVALLGNTHSAVVEELVKTGETRDRAAARIWSAKEAVWKALNGNHPEFSVVESHHEAVLLEAKTASGSYQVITFPVQLTRNPERMVALVVLKNLQTQTQTPLDPSNASFEDRVESMILPNSHRVRFTDDGPQGQKVYEQRFPVSFREACSVSRQVPVSQFIGWVGKIRELPLRCLSSQMLSDFFSGDWSMVTNSVTLRLLGEATTYDIIQARCWLGNVVDSSFDTYIEFCKVRGDETLERIALAEVKATWVRLVNYGVHTPCPCPDYLQKYLDHFAATKLASIDLKNSPTVTLLSLPESLSGLHPGKTIYEVSPQTHHYGDLLLSEAFQTTLEESDVVGNVYYSNYFLWQGRMLDLFLYSVAPEYLRVSKPKGEMVSVFSRMLFLREAMPFDKVRVVLYIKSVSECGAVFNFEFFREQPDGNTQKLQVGEQEVIWALRHEGTPVPTPWPSSVLEALLHEHRGSREQGIGRIYSRTAL